MARQFPLREQRKAETRRSLILSAQTLFASKGYEQTTLEEIAQHAGLHVQTLYRHFANKVELANAGDQEWLDRFRDAIRQPGRTDDTLTFWRAWVAKSAKRVTVSDGGLKYRERLIAKWGSPFVSAQAIRIAHEYEDLLAESLHKDLGDDDESISLARLIAITLYGANAHVLRRYATDSDFDLAKEAVSVIDRIEEEFGSLLKRA